MSGAGAKPASAPTHPQASHHHAHQGTHHAPSRAQHPPLPAPPAPFIAQATVALPPGVGPPGPAGAAAAAGASASGKDASAAKRPSKRLREELQVESVAARSPKRQLKGEKDVEDALARVKRLRQEFGPITEQQRLDIVHLYLMLKLRAAGDKGDAAAASSSSSSSASAAAAAAAAAAQAKPSAGNFQKEVVALLGYSSSTVAEAWKQFTETGSVGPAKPRPANRKPKAMRIGGGKPVLSMVTSFVVAKRSRDERVIAKDVLAHLVDKGVLAVDVADGKQLLPALRAVQRYLRKSGFRRMGKTLLPPVSPDGTITLAAIAPSPLGATGGAGDAAVGVALGDGHGEVAKIAADADDDEEEEEEEEEEDFDDDDEGGGGGGGGGGGSGSSRRGGGVTVAELAVPAGEAKGK
jgi:hypothetical protein